VSFLLDTNVVSEWTKSRPDVGVVAWLAEADEDRVFVSVITLAELRHRAFSDQIEAAMWGGEAAAYPAFVRNFGTLLG